MLESLARSRCFLYAHTQFTLFKVLENGGGPTGADMLMSIGRFSPLGLVLSGVAVLWQAFESTMCIPGNMVTGKLMYLICVGT